MSKHLVRRGLALVREERKALVLQEDGDVSREKRDRKKEIRRVERAKKTKGKGERLAKVKGLKLVTTKDEVVREKATDVFQSNMELYNMKRNHSRKALNTIAKYVAGSSGRSDPRSIDRPRVARKKESKELKRRRKQLKFSVRNIPDIRTSEKGKHCHM